MGRIKRGYVREIPDDELKRDYRLFAIACEGSKREREYFQQLEGISRRVIVEYIKDEEYEKDPPSSPQHVLRRALEYAEKVDLNDEDSVWLVMDVDRWGGKALNEVHDECSRRQNWHIVLSNPCFEVYGCCIIPQPAWTICRLPLATIAKRLSAPRLRKDTTQSGISC